MTRAIEDLGFDSVWVGEHLLYRWEDRPARGPWEAWTLLAAIAASTTRIELGPLVACTNFHNPALLAKQAATIDELSGGRFVLGLGAGWNETEFRAYGYPYDHRIDRFEEAFTIIRTLLREGAIDFDGRWYQARDCELLPRGPRPAGPPLMIGSNGPRMLRATMAHADSWNSWYNDVGNRPDGVAPLRDQVDEACREVGRDPAEVERTVAVLVRLPGGAGRLQGDPRQGPMPPVSSEPAELAETLRAFAAEGIAHVQLVLDPITRAVDRGAGAGPRDPRPRRHETPADPAQRRNERASIAVRDEPSIPASSDARSSPDAGSDDVSALDKRIIEHLQADGRRPFTQIAADLGVSEAAVRARTNRLIERGILQVVGVTDPLKLGFHQMAMIGIRCESDKLIEVAEHLAEMPEVDYVVITAGSYDLLIETVCEDNEALLVFLAERLRAIDGVRDTETFVYLRLVKQTYQYGTR